MSIPKIRHEIVFTSPGQAEFREQEWTPEPGRTVIRTLRSIVSAGTELAVLRGVEDWAPLPYVPGYGAVGEVVRVGEDHPEAQVGDVIFTHGSHASYGYADCLALPIPEGLDLSHAALARIGQVSFTSLRVCHAELGDTVAVQGLGLVGLMACQLFKLAGCRVIGIDVDAYRLRVAESLGLYAVLDAGRDAVAERVQDLTEGGCEVVVEATGRPDGVATATALARDRGEVVLLGTPRGVFTQDTTALLRDVHMCDRDLRLRGAHEWVLAAEEEPENRYKHSIRRNVRQFLGMLADGSVVADSLITHRAEPAEAVEIYQELQTPKSDLLGVIFDWENSN